MSSDGENCESLKQCGKRNSVNKVVGDWIYTDDVVGNDEIQKAVMGYVATEKDGQGNSEGSGDQLNGTFESFDYDSDYTEIFFDSGDESEWSLGLGSSTETLASASNFSELHSAANVFKENGNEFVRQRDYANALLEYTKAIDLFDTEPIFYSNRAFVYLKLEQYDLCIDDCDKALLFDYCCSKALYRRMLAFEMMENFFAAFYDIRKLLELDPSCTLFQKCFERLTNKIDAEKPVPKFTANMPNSEEVVPIKKSWEQASKIPLQRVVIDQIETHRYAYLNDYDVSDEVIEFFFGGSCDYVEIKKNVKPTPSPVAEAEVDGNETDETISTNSDDSDY